MVAVQDRHLVRFDEAIPDEFGSASAAAAAAVASWRAHEAAGALAERMLAQPQEHRLTWGMQQALIRPVSAEQTEPLQMLLDDVRQEFEAAPESAAELLRNARAEVAENQPAAELAAGGGPVTTVYRQWVGTLARASPARRASLEALLASVRALRAELAVGLGMAPGSVFAYGSEAVAIQFEAPAVDNASIGDQIAAGFARVDAMFKPNQADPTPPVPPKQEQQAPANDNDKMVDAITQLGATFAAIVKPIADAQAQID